jgi:hypothetical protein
LQRYVRLAREREQRFDEVYKNPSSYSQRERNLAANNLPPLPVPKECMTPGSETTLNCMRYAARLHALPFFMSTTLSATGAFVYIVPSPPPDDY